MKGLLITPSRSLTKYDKFIRIKTNCMTYLDIYNDGTIKPSWWLRLSNCTLVKAHWKLVTINALLFGCALYRVVLFCLGMEREE